MSAIRLSFGGYHIQAPSFFLRLFAIQQIHKEAKEWFPLIKKAVNLIASGLIGCPLNGVGNGLPKAPFICVIESGWVTLGVRYEVL